MASQVLYIHRPFLTGGAARHAVQYPKKVVVQAKALFQILSHAVRRKPGQQRVIGTLLGTRSEDGSEVEVKTAYIIPVTEDAAEVQVDINYHLEMFNLLRKSHPGSVILGWYATAPELNNLSALIHTFYSQENGTAPHPAIHLTVDPNAKGIELQAYVTSPVWASPDNSVDGNCIFVPVAHSVKFDETDELVLASVSNAETPEGGEVLGVSDTVDEAIREVLDQIDAVAAKVAEARSTNSPENDALARYLYKTLSTSPLLEAPSTLPPQKGSQSGVNYDPRSAMFNAHLRDLVAMVNLTNSIKWQVQLTSEVSSTLSSKVSI